MGIYDYVDYIANYPRIDYPSIDRIRFFGGLGAMYIDSESGHGWGGAGITQYINSKVLWNPSLSVEDILVDFCDKAFGDAAALMQNYL